jgi:hypothetical protein
MGAISLETQLVDEGARHSLPKIGKIKTSDFSSDVFVIIEE